jgi:hypothetical protein
LKGKIVQKIFFLPLVLLLLAACEPPKVTDPNDPRFDPMKFSMRDYNTEPSLQNALVRIFPKGTSKDYVDSILVKRNGLSRGIINNEDGSFFITYYKDNHDFSRWSWGQHKNKA